MRERDSVAGRRCALQVYVIQSEWTLWFLNGFRRNPPPPPTEGSTYHLWHYAYNSSASHFSTRLQSTIHSTSNSMKFLNPLVLAVAFVAVSADENSTSILLPMNMSAPGSMDDAPEMPSLLEDSFDGSSGSDSASDYTSASGESFSGDSMSSSVSASGSSGSSGSSKNMDTSMSLSTDGSSGSEDLTIDEPIWSEDNSGSSYYSTEEADNLFTSASTDSGSSSAATSIQRAAFYTTASVVVVAAALF